MYSNKNSSKEDQTKNSYCQGKDGSLAKSQISSTLAGITVVAVPIKCIHCKSSIISLEDLRKHITVHLDPAIMNTDPKGKSVETPKYVCGDCGEAFSNQDDFSSHSCQRHGSKFACFICGERFASLKELRVHVEWHFDKIPYECCQCSAKFSTSSMHQKHVLEHKSGKKFKCTKCDNEFSDFNALKIHMQIHYSNTRKSCIICGRRFSRQSQLREHLATDHSTDKLYTYLEQSSNSNSISPISEESRAKTTNFTQTVTKFSKRRRIDHQNKSTPDKNKEDRKEPVKCLHCESTFISLVQVFKHMTFHIDPAILNADPKLVCGDCAVTFQNKKKLFLTVVHITGKNLSDVRFVTSGAVCH